MADPLRQTTVEHYLQLEPKYAPVRMAELAPGVIAVEDVSGECDAMFDTKRWQFAKPELWSGRPESPLTKGTTLDYLEGIGSSRPIRTIQGMMHFARGQLSPTSDTKWHETPQFFDF